MSDATATLTFYGNQQGYWRVTAKAYVTYNDAPGGHQWDGEGVTVTDCVTGKAGGEAFVFEAMPNDANALRNVEFIVGFNRPRSICIPQRCVNDSATVAALAGAGSARSMMLSGEA